jgi:cellulose synthase (UDP-forming)
MGDGLVALYENASELAGELESGSRVRYRRVFSRTENRQLKLLVTVNVAASLSLVVWLLLPYHWPAAGNSWSRIIAGIAIFMMAATELIRLAQGAALWIFAANARDPIPLRPHRGMRVAVLTTIVPGKEPLDLVARTLEAMRRIEYDGVVDVWLLDEGNDAEVKTRCADLGVHHFSRRGVPAYNQPSGAFKAKTKAGNHNAWRHAYENYYQIVAQMDPDHVPTRDFLIRTLGYFVDPDVGFVVAPQVYGNLADNWIARGSAFLAYVFHGIMQRGGNGLQAPLLIGTNHLYRVRAFQQIGGYQDSIIEDHLTAMVLYSAKNPTTGNRWKGVYTPDILAIGEGPASFTDFFNQQKRWAYGIWEIAKRHSPRIFGRLMPSQRLSFALLQLFYPSVALSWILSNTVTALFLFGGFSSRLPVAQWALLWATSMISNFVLYNWLRRFNLVEHERKDRGIVGMSLMFMCTPVYVEAAAASLTGKPLAYAVTAKGNLTSPDSLKTFRPHLYWAAGSASLLIVNVAGVGSAFLSLRIWLCFTLVTCLAPVAIHYTARLRPTAVSADVTGRSAHAQHRPTRTTSGALATPGRVATAHTRTAPRRATPVHRRPVTPRRRLSYSYDPPTVDLTTQLPRQRADLSRSNW